VYKKVPAYVLDDLLVAPGVLHISGEVPAGDSVGGFVVIVQQRGRAAFYVDRVKPRTASVPQKRQLPATSGIFSDF